MIKTKSGWWKFDYRIDEKGIFDQGISYMQMQAFVLILLEPAFWNSIAKSWCPKS